MRMRGPVCNKWGPHNQTTGNGNLNPLRDASQARELGCHALELPVRM